MHPTLQRFKEGLEIRGLAPTTVKAYTSQAAAFVLQIGKSIGELDLEDVRRHLVYLKTKRGLSGSTINQALSAIRCFYLDIRGLDWDRKQLRCHNLRRKLPVVLARREVEGLFQATDKIKYRTIFMTMYSAGLRAE